MRTTYDYDMNLFIETAVTDLVSIWIACGKTQPNVVLLPEEMKEHYKGKTYMKIRDYINDKDLMLQIIDDYNFGIR